MFFGTVKVVTIRSWDQVNQYVFGHRLKHKRNVLVTSCNLSVLLNATVLKQLVKTLGFLAFRPLAVQQRQNSQLFADEFAILVTQRLVRMLHQLAKWTIRILKLRPRPRKKQLSECDKVDGSLAALLIIGNNPDESLVVCPAERQGKLK